MTNLRKSILFMVIHLSIVFNIERLDFGAENVIDIQSFTYVLILALVTTTLAIRPLQRYSFYYGVFFWLAVFLAIKIIISNSHPIFGGVYTYLTVTEMALVTISVFLAYDLARALTDFESVIEKVTIPKLGQRVLTMKEAAEEIKTEFSRSRRHKRPLSVLIIRSVADLSDLKLEKLIRDVQKAMLDRFVSASIAKLISVEARRVDIIIEQEEKNTFILLCPETTSEGSVNLGARLKKLALERLGISISCGVAGFPEGNLTFDDLLLKAEEDFNKQNSLPVVAYSHVGKE